MATIVSTLFSSLDGVVEVDPTWHFPYYDAAMGAAVSDDYADVDILLFGRVTYESFAGAWPERTGEFAEKVNSMPKYVVATTLDELAWNNSYEVRVER